MDTLTIILLVAVGIGSGFIQRVSGFGLGIFAMIFLPYLMSEPATATAVSCLISCGATTYNTIKYRKSIPYKTILPLLASSLVVIPIAVYYAKSISGDFFEMLLGIVLILLSTYLLFFDSRVSIKPSVKNGLLAGTVGGALGGLFSTAGPPVVLYLTYATKEKMAYFSGLQFYFCLTNYYATAFRIANGVITSEVLIAAAIGLVGCMAGDLLGRLIFDKLDGAKLKKIIYAGMIISGILMII